MNVLFLSPGFPSEMPNFVRGLAEVGVQVIGLGDQPPAALPDTARHALSHYVQVGSLFDEESVVREVQHELRGHRIDRVESVWEPLMLLAARLREALGVPGMTVAETLPFRDKTAMKNVLQRAGLRTPHHARAATESEVRAAVEQLGYPLIVKPVDGAGSADTHRLDGPDDLEKALPAVRHVPELSVEEFIEGEEFTFDTVCHDGQIDFFNVSWYRPRPLLQRQIEWLSPQTVALRNVEAEHLQPGIELGKKTLEALGFRTGFTHMEWFLKEDGEAVFGEIGARPPGARSVDIMNYSCDIDLFRGWAEATCHKRFTQPVRRLYNTAIIFKRAHGQGRIQRIEGLRKLHSRFGRHIVGADLLPIGAQRRNWKQTLLSDGWVFVRHPDLETTMRMADAVGAELKMWAE